TAAAGAKNASVRRGSRSESKTSRPARNAAAGNSIAAVSPAKNPASAKRQACLIANDNGLLTTDSPGYSANIAVQAATVWLFSVVTNVVRNVAKQPAATM